MRRPWKMRTEARSMSRNDHPGAGKIARARDGGNIARVLAEPTLVRLRRRWAGTQIGRQPDTKVGLAVGLTRERVRQVRQALGLPAWCKISGCARKRERVLGHPRLLDWTARQLAADVGCSTSYVRHVAQDAGIELSPGRPKRKKERLDKNGGIW